MGSVGGVYSADIRPIRILVKLNWASHFGMPGLFGGFLDFLIAFNELHEVRNAACASHFASHLWGFKCEALTWAQLGFE